MSRAFARLAALQILAIPSVLLAGQDVTRRTLLGQPRLLLLDEPLEGLAPLIRQELLRAFAALSQSFGITVVIVKQQVQEALGHTSRALVLERGAVVHAAPAHELRKDAQTLERLVGMAVH
jgi:branched-chain amino acid transport system ATP-binding protein